MPIVQHSESHALADCAKYSRLRLLGDHCCMGLQRLIPTLLRRVRRQRAWRTAGLGPLPSETGQIDHGKRFDVGMGQGFGISQDESASFFASLHLSVFRLSRRWKHGPYDEKEKNRQMAPHHAYVPIDEIRRGATTQ